MGSFETDKTHKTHTSRIILETAIDFLAAKERIENKMLKAKSSLTVRVIRF